MDTAGTLLDELRSQYEAVQKPTKDRLDVEKPETIDRRMRKAFRWLEQAMAYLNGLKPPIDSRFDLGYGFFFDSPRFAHGSVSQHERRIAGYPVLETIDVYYEMSAAKPLSIDVPPGWVKFAETTLDGFELQYTSHRVEEPDGRLHSVFAVLPVIPARVSFRIDHQLGRVTVTLTNVDRLDRVALEFPSRAIDDSVLEDLVRLMLGRDSLFLRRAPLAGVRR